MHVDNEKIDKLIQFCLLVAGEEDYYANRSLGPIHFLKYVYLADYYFARRNNGVTYTGIEWKFFNFGPWSLEVNKRIEPALKAIMAEKYIGQSDYGDGEYTCWTLNDEYRLSSISRSIPSSITLKLKKDIHSHLQDTDSLLSFVYSTEPMVNAAPDEFLDFSTIVTADNLDTEEDPITSLSQKQKQRLAAIKELKAKRRESLKAKQELVAPIKPPRYDEIFELGVNWLGQIDGPPIENEKIKMKFDQSIWKSGLRRNGELS